VEGDRWPVVATLVDPIRRALYEHVRRQDHAVTREEAADAVEISRGLSAFHLDKLVDAGLLRARYEAPAGEPRGRGRTPKVYEANDDGLQLAIPPRQYELVGTILADALAHAPTDAPATARRLAAESGRDIGNRAAHRPGRRHAVAAELDLASAALTDLGYEPSLDRELQLTNCPFHSLARRQPELICGLNVAFVSGLLDGLGTTTLRAALDPHPDRCCVTITPTNH
jgi:predicted ArsR family transcriptional regulator